MVFEVKLDASCFGSDSVLLMILQTILERRIDQRSIPDIMDRN